MTTGRINQITIVYIELYLSSQLRQFTYSSTSLHKGSNTRFILHLVNVSASESIGHAQILSTSRVIFMTHNVANHWAQLCHV